jgi:hypothetical protein
MARSQLALGKDAEAKATHARWRTYIDQLPQVTPSMRAWALMQTAMNVIGTMPTRWAEAQVILAQTNNADFGKTDENLQQLAIARLRAIETGRSVVNISTVGTSQIIAPDGSTISSITPYEAGSMIADVPLATTNSPGTLLAQGVELLVSGWGLAGLILVLLKPARVRPRSAHEKAPRPS